MMDALNKIYEALSADSVIYDAVENRIKYYEYPDTGAVDKAYIIIDPLQPSMPDDYADNDWLTEEHLIQIDIWSKSREEKDKLGERIRMVMKNIGFYQSGGGIDEYDKDVKIYRDARRYLGKFYRNDI